MNATLAALDREWAEMKDSSAGAEALRRWATSEPALAGMPTLAAVLEARTDEEAAPVILSGLARLSAAGDELAARTLLQALVPGLVKMAYTICRDDRLAFDELLSLAWERIRTYPTSRPGSVAGNVLLDVRKCYWRHREIDVPKSYFPDSEGPDTAPSAEEIVLGQSAVDDLVAARRDGVISTTALALILRTRLEDAPLATAALEQGETTKNANCIRWRAERRLRPVLAMAS